MKIQIQNMVQYNGSFGCSFYLNEGETVPKGNGHTRIYRPNVEQLRDANQVYADAESALLQDKPVRDVKGFSPLSEVPIFDVVRSFVPDYMHALLLGFVRTLCNLWFDSTNSDAPWYIGFRSDEITRRLLGIMTSCEINRTTRGIDMRVLWKASEWRSFLLYYSLAVL